MDREFKQRNVNQNSINCSHYTYKDWANVPPNQIQVSPFIAFIFLVVAIIFVLITNPFKKICHGLLTILHSGYSDAIQWLPHGRSWRIKDKAKLMNEVLPRYFQIANFNSFVRLVNAWGFRRIKFGSDIDSYYHELFLRGMPHLHVRMKRLLSKEKKVPLLSKGQVPHLYAMPPVPAEKGSATNEASPHQNPNSRRNDDSESKVNPTESSYFSTLHRDMHSKAATSYFQSTFPATQRDMNTDKYTNFSAASGSRSIIHQYSRSPIGGQHEINTTTQQCWAPNTTKEIEGFEITTRIKPYFRQHLTSITDFRQLWSLQQQHTIGLQRSADSPAQLKAVSRQQTNLAHLQAASSNWNSHGRRRTAKKTTLGTISSSNMQSLRALPSALLAQKVIKKWGDSLREGTQSEFSVLRASNFVLSPRYVLYHVPKCMEDHNQSAQTEVRYVDNGRIK